MTRANSVISASDQTEISETLSLCLPSRVRDYLFEPSGEVRRQPFDLSRLRIILAKHLDSLHSSVVEAFQQGWPTDDVRVVEPASFTELYRGDGRTTSGILARLKRRLDWAIDQMNRLDEVRRTQGTLDPEQDALRNRCDRYVKRLKGTDPRRRRDAEGFDDTNTYSVLAAEGFLPGYGLDNGWVIGTYEAPRFNPSFRDWELRRHPSLALREYVPGNLIYANGQRFIPSHFRLEPREPVRFQVDVSNEAVAEVEGSPHGWAGIANYRRLFHLRR